jgi:hypothetical protein
VAEGGHVGADVASAPAGKGGETMIDFLIAYGGVAIVFAILLLSTTGARL